MSFQIQVLNWMVTAAKYEPLSGTEAVWQQTSRSEPAKARRSSRDFVVIGRSTFASETDSKGKEGSHVEAELLAAVVLEYRDIDVDHDVQRRVRMERQPGS